MENITFHIDETRYASLKAVAEFFKDPLSEIYSLMVSRFISEYREERYGLEHELGEHGMKAYNYFYSLIYEQDQKEKKEEKRVKKSKTTGNITKMSAK